MFFYIFLGVLVSFFLVQYKRKNIIFPSNVGNICPKSDKERYIELLNDNNWKIKRENILKRDSYKCKWCGDITNLQVHHKYYSKYPNEQKVLPWNYPDNALVTLCDNCHKKAHNKAIKIYYRKYNDNY